MTMSSLQAGQLLLDVLAPDVAKLGRVLGFSLQVSVGRFPVMTIERAPEFSADQVETLRHRFELRPMDPPPPAPTAAIPFDLDAMEAAAKASVHQFVKAAARSHLAAMANGFAQSRRAATIRHNRRALELAAITFPELAGAAADVEDWFEDLNEALYR
jgi:hypothetical protein